MKSLLLGARQSSSVVALGGTAVRSSSYSGWPQRTPREAACPRPSAAAFGQLLAGGFRHYQHEPGRSCPPQTGRRRSGTGIRSRHGITAGAQQLTRRCRAGIQTFSTGMAHPQIIHIHIFTSNRFAHQTIPTQMPPAVPHHGRSSAETNGITATPVTVARNELFFTVALALLGHRLSNEAIVRRMDPPRAEIETSDTATEKCFYGIFRRCVLLWV